ncbi:hypothetical protein Pfo_026137 [Paulownia fortunei]|nr:hypothetical protein Pfo_026137 [Paulownia fortunei]
MGTEVLRSQDLLVERFHVPPSSFQRRRNFPGNGNLTNLIVTRKPSNNAGYKKTSPKPDKKRSNPTVDNGGTKKGSHGGAAETRRRDDGAKGGLTMGQVTLLRRGESLDSFGSKTKVGNPKLKSPKPVDDLAVLGTERIGPNSPEMVPKQIRLSSPSLPNVYAGSAFSLSPSPRSVPLPSFFNKKQQNDSEIKPFDSATKDLRRLLRLD